MHNYEKESLHYEVIANNLERASKIARTISSMCVSDYIDNEKLETNKKRLREAVLGVLTV